MKPKLNRELGWRIFIVLFLSFLWQGSQYLISTLKTDYLGNGLVDLSFKMTEFFNHLLADNAWISRAVFIITSLEVDLLVISLILFSIIKKNYRLLFGLILIAFLRQFSEAIVLLPKPNDLIWYYPGFPSLFVSYGVSNDFFFSGHTAAVVYATVFWNDQKIVPGLKIFLWVMLGIQVLMVLSTRIHYYMDVYAAIVTSLAVYWGLVSRPAMKLKTSKKHPVNQKKLESI